MPDVLPLAATAEPLGHQHGSCGTGIWGALVPHGEVWPASSAFCSGSITPAQASAETAISFKIWPQTFITHC